MPPCRLGGVLLLILGLGERHGDQLLPDGVYLWAEIIGICAHHQAPAGHVLHGPAEQLIGVHIGKALGVGAYGWLAKRLLSPKI